MSQVLHQFYAGLITAVDVTVSLCLRMKDGDGRYEWRQYERLTQSYNVEPVQECIKPAFIQMANRRRLLWFKPRERLLKGH